MAHTRAIGIKKTNKLGKINNDNCKNFNTPTPLCDANSAKEIALENQIKPHKTAKIKPKALNICKKIYLL